MSNAALWGPWLLIGVTVLILAGAIVWLGRRLPTTPPPPADLPDWPALKKEVDDLSRAVHTLTFQVDSLRQVVSVMDEERRITLAVERESARQQQRRTGDTIQLNHNTGPLQQQGGARFDGPTRIEGGVAGGDIGKIGKLERHFDI